MDRNWTTLTAMAAAVALSACATRTATVESDNMDDGMMARWSADIEIEADPGHGGTADAFLTDDGTSVTVTLSTGSSGGEHPWHVHEGTCGSGGGIVGDAATYPLLRPGADNDASETALLDVQLDPDQSYYINIHQSPSNLGTIVGCGELVMR